MTRSAASGAPDRPFVHLAEHLTTLRRAARLTQRALAQAANVSRGAVQRAESGAAAPSPTVLDAFVRVCGAGPGDQARAHLLRNRGRTTKRNRLRLLNAPAPALIHTEADLSAALAAAYERAGAPSLSDSRLTPGRPPLPRTTAWRIVERKGLPATTAQLVTFLTACGVHPAEQRLYINAYHRITADRGTRPAPPPARRTLTSGRIHRVPLAHGGTDTGTGFDLTALATHLTMIGEVIAADRARFDLTALATGVKVVGEAIAADRARYDLTALATGIAVVGEAVAAASRSASREAHRNGTTAPDLWLIDHAAETPDLLVRTTDGDVTAYQLKRYAQHRPGPPPKALAPAPAGHAA
jgi:transcriptional regulator with XRE-family HTH domain